MALKIVWTFFHSERDDFFVFVCTPFGSPAMSDVIAAFSAHRFGIWRSFSNSCWSVWHKVIILFVCVLLIDKLLFLVTRIMRRDRSLFVTLRVAIHRCWWSVMHRSSMLPSSRCRRCQSRKRSHRWKRQRICSRSSTCSAGSHRIRKCWTRSTVSTCSTRTRCSCRRTSTTTRLPTIRRRASSSSRPTISSRPQFRRSTRSTLRFTPAAGSSRCLSNGKRALAMLTCLLDRAVARQSSLVVQSVHRLLPWNKRSS